MASEQKRCPKCGTTFSASEKDVSCPACALELAAGGMSWGMDDVSEHVEGESELSPPTADAVSTAKGSGPPYSASSFDLGSPYRRFGLTVLLVILAIYFGIRLVSSYQNVKPSTIIDQDLHVVFDHSEYGLTTGHELVRVNDTPVTSFPEYRAAISALDGDRVSLGFVDPEGDAEDGDTEVLWIGFSRPVEFTISESLEFTPRPAAFPDDVFLPEERVIAVNGVAIDEAVRQGLDDDALRRFRTRFTTLINAESGREVVIQHVNWAVFAGRYFVGLGMAVLALIAVWLKPNARSARSFFFFAVFLSALWFARAIPFHHRSNVEYFVYLFAQCFVFVPCLLFLFIFTPLRNLQMSRRLPAILGAGIGCLLIGVSAILDPTLTRYGLLLPVLQLVWAGSLLLALIFALTSGIWTRFLSIPTSSTDKERLRITWISLFFGVLPMLAYSLFRFRQYLLEHTDRAYEFDFLIELTALIFPLALLYGVVRHNLLRANELLRESFFYLLLISGLIGFYGLVAGILQLIAPESNTWLGPALVAGTVVVAIPVHTRARTAILRRFDRVPVAYASFIQSLRHYWSSSPTPRDYCLQILEELRAVTGARNVEICARSPNDGQWAILAASPVPKTDVTTDRCSGLFALMENESSPVYRDDILEDVRFRDSRGELIEGMNALAALMVFPLVAFDRLVGALAVGEKMWARNYTASEIRSLIRISQRIGEDLSNLSGPAHLGTRRRIADIFPQFPEKIGRYRIERVIGEGGMSYVYLGIAGDKEVAIKVANRFVQNDSTLLERFRREASAIQWVRSPYTVEVIEVGWEGQEPYIVMEYFRDGSLSEIIKNDGPMTESEASQAIVHAIRGLETALDLGIVHRDVKPRNLFRTPEGVVKVGDFGLALMTEWSSFTPPAKLMGTPEYISPELIEGHAATWRSDQYALGITFFELLTGKKPFSGAEFQIVFYQHLNKPVPDVRRFCREVSAETSNIIKRMLAKDPENRFESYRELAETIEATLDLRTKT